MEIINKLSVEGYLSIRHLDSLDLRPLNVLIGANGSGKSNLLSVFELVAAAADRHLQLYVQQRGGADSLLFHGSGRAGRMRFQLTWAGAGSRTELAAALIPAEPDRLVVADERLLLPAQAVSDPAHVHATAGATELALSDTKAELRPLQDRLRSMRVYHLNDTAQFAKVRVNSDASDTLRLRDDAGNLAAYLYYLRDAYPYAYERIVATIRLDAPFFGDFVLEPQPSSVGDRILLRWTSRDSAYVFGPHQLSDGTIRLMALVTLLLQPVDRLPRMVLLDEPELGLHPFAIELVASLVKSVSERSQVIVSTQSPTFVDHFSPDDLVVCEQRNGESIFERLEPHQFDEWLANYSLGDLMARNVTGAGA